MRKQLLVYILLIPIFFGFFIQSWNNYILHTKVKQEIVEHPEKLPQWNFAILSSFWNRNILADIYWLQAIQYIGSNVISGEYKRYLFAMMNLITDIDPNFVDPYVIGQLLLPASNDRYETFSYDEVKNNIEQGEKLWLKGIENFCDQDKISAIIAEENLQKIIDWEEYRNPCREYKIPYYLAYIYHFHLDDSLSAANYYKVVSAQDDAPSGARILAAIMQGKWGEREKSTYMFLSLAQSLSSKEDACNFISSKIEETYNYISIQKQPITAELVQSIELVFDEIYPQITRENELSVLDDTKCLNYLAKAIREINLMYIEAADRKYVQDHPNEVSAHTPEKLFETWYISFIPTDYQQYADESYGIVYRYNKKVDDLITKCEKKL